MIECFTRCLTEARELPYRIKPAEKGLTAVWQLSACGPICIAHFGSRDMAEDYLVRLLPLRDEAR